jgi:hypothetical protein
MSTAMNARRVGLLVAPLTAVLLVTNAATGISPVAAVSKSAFSVVASKRSVSVAGGGSVSVRVSVQTKGASRPMSYAVSSKLKRVSLTMTDESAAGVTVVLAATTAATKQKGFVDVVAKSGGKAKRVRFSVSVVPGKAPVVDGSPVTVAATTVVATPPPVVTTLPGVTTLPPVAPTTNPVAPTTAGTAKPVGDFALSVDEPTKTVSLGQATTVLVIVAPAGGYSGAPEFDVVGAPAGVLPQFEQPKSKTGTKLTFTASASAPRGSFPITIGASDGANRRTVPFILVIKKYAAKGEYTINVKMPTLVASGASVPVEVRVSPVTPGDDVPAATVRVETGFQTVQALLAENQPSMVLTLSVPTTASDSGWNVEVDVISLDGSVKQTKIALDVTNDLKFMFSAGSSVTAETRLIGGTIDGNFALPISAREVFGAQPVIGKCSGVPTGMIAVITGTGTSYQLNFSARLLPLGSYTISCGMSSGQIDYVLTATFVAKFKSLTVGP